MLNENGLTNGGTKAPGSGSDKAAISTTSKREGQEGRYVVHTDPSGTWAWGENVNEATWEQVRRSDQGSVCSKGAKDGGRWKSVPGAIRRTSLRAVVRTESHSRCLMKSMT